MKKHLLSLLLTLALVCAALPAPALADHPIQSDALILMDADTGEILLSSNRHKKLYPASITKVLTCLLVAEKSGADEVATASAAAVKIPAGYAHVGLAAGDTISVGDAMYAMMLPSANDAAAVLAEHVAGSQSAFAAMMNARAKEIGAENSNFVNPHGMPDKSHYTTVSDMALITREAWKNQTFRRYFQAKSYLLPSLNSRTRQTQLRSYQYMMLEDKDEYHPDVVGGKIGYTPESGHTMVTVATRGGRTLICVVMGSDRNGKYEDTRNLINYGFSL